MNHTLVGALLVLVVVCRHAMAQAPSGDRLPVTAVIRALAGCYRVRAAPWSAAQYGGDVPSRLPAIVRLDTVPQRVMGRGQDFRASPDVKAYHEFPFAPGWRVAPDGALTISWWDAYTGPVLVLRPRGLEWHGTASYHNHNASGPAPTAAVRVTRTRCPADGPA